MAIARIDGKHTKTSTVTLTDMVLALGCNLRILSGYTCSETGLLSCVGEILSG